MFSFPETSPLSLTTRLVITIDFQLSWMSCHSSLIPGIASKQPTMPVPYRLDDQDWGSLANHGCSNGRFWANWVPFQAPSNRDGSISMRHGAGQLGKSPLIYHVRSKGKWYNSRWFWKVKEMWSSSSKTNQILYILSFLLSLSLPHMMSKSTIDF